MKAKLRVIIPVVVILLLITILTINVSNFAQKQDALNRAKNVSYNNVEMTELIDKVFMLKTYDNLDYEKANDYFKDIYDNFGCSSFVTELENGDTVVGRNYDLSISKKPIYIVKTDVKNNYRTLGLSYTNMSFDDYDVVKEKGLSNDALAMIPFAQSDVLNEKGLYIEENMRTNEYDEDEKSIFASSGTNPDAKERVCALNIPLLVAQRCKNVDEAIKLFNELDIYSMQSEKCDFILSYMIADKKGNYGVVEIIDNKVIWHDKANIQTNFFLDEEYQEKEQYKCGLGRYELIEKEIKKVKEEKDVRTLLDKLLYFTMYDYDNCAFDNKSEFVGLYPEWTNEYMDDEDNSYKIKSKIISVCNKVQSYDRNELEELNTYWETVYSVVTNVNKLKMKIKFNENDDRIISIGLNDKENKD